MQTSKLTSALHYKGPQRENPHKLYADYAWLHNKNTVHNLIFHTTTTPFWKSILEAYFKYVAKEGIARDRKLVYKDGNLDTDSITYYSKVIVLMQENEKHPLPFTKAFPSLKVQAEKESECDMAEVLESEE